MPLMYCDCPYSLVSPKKAMTQTLFEAFNNHMLFSDKCSHWFFLKTIYYTIIHPTIISPETMVMKL